MALTPDEFDRPELSLSPELHREQAEMAADRGRDYDAEAFEALVEQQLAASPELDDAEAIPGREELLAEWLDEE